MATPEGWEKTAPPRARIATACQTVLFFFKELVESDEGEQTEDECDDVIGADKPLYRAEVGDVQEKEQG